MTQNQNEKENKTESRDTKHMTKSLRLSGSADRYSDLLVGCHWPVRSGAVTGPETGVTEMEYMTLLVVDNFHYK